ncbi:MAG: HAMP domain-containing histidine kinase [Acidimicrobiia bacterium]|nr:HAMP domain-containing histidine kinase [Acidimicrobiia bacterium]MDH3397938.1 HAMP domain-containing histidine kinase [Acidimicrobiia bacterium]MDH5615653.1 HAMP domain-containing histidine kinase [Acidimicrobiia bacterium]
MRRRFFWSMLAVAGVALMVVATLGAVLTRVRVVQQTRTEVARQAEAVAGLVEEAASVDGRVTARRMLELLRDGRADLGTDAGDRFVRLLTSAQRVTGGSLIDLGWIGADGILHLVRNPGLGNALGFDTSSLLAGEDQFRRIQLPQEAQTLEAVAHPMDVVDQGGITPVIVIAQRSDLINWREIMRGLIVPFAIAAVLSAFAARSLSFWLGSRLSGLAGAAHRLAAGDLAARAGEEGNDEIAELSQTFNVMATRLEEVQAREQDFLMSVGHDLRTPLTTIGGYAEALDEGELDEEEIRRIAGVLSSETDRLRRLVEDLMLLARLEAREFTIRLELVDVGAHLAEIAETYRDRAEALRVRLDVEVEETGIMVTDPDRLAQIAANLTENALRFTPEAGRVTVSVRTRDERIELSVEDTGPGIDQDDLPRVFEKFYVARNYRRVRPEGSGLGLAIVKQLVDAMGGTISAQSTPGTGTRFVVSIPAASASDD